MRSLHQSHKESSRTTRSFSVLPDLFVVPNEDAHKTSATRNNVIVIEYGQPAAKSVKGHDIDDVIKELFSDAKSKSALGDANKWLAQEFYQNENSIRALRLKNGMSQGDLATAMGTKQSHISRIESGGYDITVGTARRMAKALNTDVLTIINALGPIDECAAS